MINKDAEFFRSRENRILRLPDGRVLWYAQYGDPEGIPVLAFHGTPGCRFMFRIVDQAARDLNLRIIAPDRPGFGLSANQPFRTISDWTRDVERLADAVGADKFSVMGLSGGGPYAAACGAILNRRIEAVALVSPLGPVASPELRKQIGIKHRFTFHLMPSVPGLLPGALLLGRAGMLYLPTAIYAYLISRASPADWKILTRPEVKKLLIESFQEGLRKGVKSAVEEVKLFSQPWDFSPEDISAPTILWQGTSDRIVPVKAALYLGDQIPGCDIRELPGQGHYWFFKEYKQILESLKNLGVKTFKEQQTGTHP